MNNWTDTHTTRYRVSSEVSPQRPRRLYGQSSRCAIPLSGGTEYRGSGVCVTQCGAIQPKRDDGNVTLQVVREWQQNDPNYGR
ncbi:unnamed protein product [Macrosiphum euphorbiae]|uniref:Uncharacterized protein n=1 Tax=Macrosiphum euphorbiae TaxID=13131 RepID=A0AAV0W303_9HEMI|nr:unnamed protein product [Macrosiphum euphorbiae]